MLGERCRRCPNINPALAQCFCHRVCCKMQLRSKIHERQREKYQNVNLFAKIILSLREHTNVNASQNYKLFYHFQNPYEREKFQTGLIFFCVAFLRTTTSIKTQVALPMVSHHIMAKWCHILAIILVVSFVDSMRRNQLVYCDEYN